MKVKHTVPFEHDGDLLGATDMVLTALGHGADFKLRADAPDDTVHGAVTVRHWEDRLEVVVEIYEADEGPIPGATVFDEPVRKSTLARPDPFPTEAEIIARLNSLA